MDSSIENQENLDQLNELGGREKTDRRQTDVAVKVERRKVQRRRLIDPTTCERDYSNDEIEFMQAMDHYKRKSGRMFPTCSEILEVLRSMGYVRVEMEDGDVENIADATDEEKSLRTNDVIVDDLDQYEELEDSCDASDFDDDFDEED